MLRKTHLQLHDMKVEHWENTHTHTPESYHTMSYHETSYDRTSYQCHTTSDLPVPNLKQPHRSLHLCVADHIAFSIGGRKDVVLGENQCRKNLTGKLHIASLAHTLTISSSNNGKFEGVRFSVAQHIGWWNLWFHLMKDCCFNAK